MANLVSSTIFCARNVDKTWNDNFARGPVVVGQFTNAMREVAKINKTFANSIAVISETSSPCLNFLKKGADFASKNVNPLICVAGGVKVLTAEDKKKELVNQTVSLGVMFSAEKAYKTLVDYDNVVKFAEKLNKKEMLNKITNSPVLKSIKDKVGDKRLKTILNIAYGLGFVTASISGYNLGEKIAQKINSQDDYKKEVNNLNLTKRELSNNNGVSKFFKC